MDRRNKKRGQGIASLGALAFVLVACAETREPEVAGRPPPKACSSQKECPKGACLMDPCILSPCTVGHCQQ